MRGDIFALKIAGSNAKVGEAVCYQDKEISGWIHKEVIMQLFMTDLDSDFINITRIKN
jgi:hypothetical protein